MGLITLLRHAPLPLKYQKRYIGHSDIEIDLSLTDISKLKKIKQEDYDLIFSSDLKRCKQTLDLLDLEYSTDKRLREVKFKDEFEAKNFSEIEEHESYDIKYLESMEVWHEYLCFESFKSFENRVKEFINSLPKNKNILICSHAGTIKLFYKLITSKDLHNIDYLEDINITITNNTNII